MHISKYNLKVENGDFQTVIDENGEWVRSEDIKEILDFVENFKLLFNTWGEYASDRPYINPLNHEQSK